MLKSNFVVDTWEDSDTEIESDDLGDKDFYEKLETEEDSLIAPAMTEYKLGPKEIEEIKRVFNKYDKNRLGYIRVQKIIEVFIKVGQNPSKTLEQTLLNQAYKQDGMIYFSELIALFEKYWKTQDQYENDLRDAFKTFDSTDTDYINLEELKDFLNAYGDQLDKKELDIFTKFIVDKKIEGMKNENKIFIEDIMKKITVKAKNPKIGKEKKSKKRSYR